MNASKKSPTYFIASISYWAGDTWSLERGTEGSRKAAEERVKALREADFDTNIKESRKFRVMTMSEVKREFGQDWDTRVRGN